VVLSGLERSPPPSTSMARPTRPQLFNPTCVSSTHHSSLRLIPRYWHEKSTAQCVSDSLSGNENENIPLLCFMNFFHTRLDPLADNQHRKVVSRNRPCAFTNWTRYVDASLKHRHKQKSDAGEAFTHLDSSVLTLISTLVRFGGNRQSWRILQYMQSQELTRWSENETLRRLGEGVEHLS